MLMGWQGRQSPNDAQMVALRMTGAETPLFLCTRVLQWSQPKDAPNQVDSLYLRRQWEQSREPGASEVSTFNHRMRRNTARTSLQPLQLPGTPRLHEAEGPRVDNSVVPAASSMSGQRTGDRVDGEV